MIGLFSGIELEVYSSIHKPPRGAHPSAYRVYPAADDESLFMSRLCANTNAAGGSIPQTL